MLKSCFAKKLTYHMPPACKNCLHPPTPQGPHLLPLAAALERLGRVLFSSTPTEHPLYTCVCEPRPKPVVTAVLEVEVHSQHSSSSHTTWPHSWLLGVTRGTQIWLWWLEQMTAFSQKSKRGSEWQCSRLGEESKPESHQNTRQAVLELN